MDKSVESIDNVNFFLNSDTSAWIAKQFGDGEPVLKLNPGETFSFDLIEQPFHIILKGEDGGSVLYLFIRNQFGVYAEESADITLTFASDGAEPVMKSNGNLAGDPESSAKHFARVGIELRRRFMESKQKLVLDDYDPDREGVFVTLCGESLLYERVKGKNRPSMKCYGFMNQSGMMRPYPDEAMEAMLLDNASPEDLLERAEGGDTDAMDLLAKQYLDDGEVEKASYWYLKLAEQGSAIGQFNIALFYLKGQGVEQDLEKVLYWMKKAQENGDDDAPKFVEKFEEMVSDKKKADEGDLSAMTNLAAAYMTLGAGDNDDNDSPLYKESLRLAKKAAKENYPHAMWVLALAYEHGRGVEYDQEKCIEYYKKGAELGDAACQNSLGCIYLDGRGVLKNEKRAFNLFTQSADQDYPLAMRSLGYCYQYGYGCKESMAKCVYWLERYLEYEDDPEIRQKAFVFKSLADDEEYDDESSDDEDVPDKIVFKDKNFVLTGFDSFAEDELKAEIERHGGRVRTSTVLDTNYLIYDERIGTDTKKYNRAKELISQGKKIVILSRRSFVNYLEGGKPATKTSKSAKNSKAAKPAKTDKTAKSDKSVAPKTKTVKINQFTFNLPAGYSAEEQLTDDGKKEAIFYKGKSIGDDGEEKYEFKLTIAEADVGNSPFEDGYQGPAGFSLEGNIDNHFITVRKEIDIMIIKATGLSVLIILRQDGHHYIVKGASKLLRSDKPEEIYTIVDGLNDFFSSLMIDGKQIELEKITADRLLNDNSDLDFMGGSDSMPRAFPKSGQHTHLDYLNRMNKMSSMFGGLLQLNATGTEYYFMPISSMVEEADRTLASYLKEMTAGKSNSALVNTAKYMSELFRMNKSCFDENHDREQEILSGLVQRASVYNYFRSFAWTFAAYCDKNGVSPAAVDIDTIYDIIDFIDQCDGLNYTADSYSPVICSGDDLHVYYVSDTVSEQTKKKLLKYFIKRSENGTTDSSIQSLNALRKELDYMYPAIREIYDELELNRNRKVPLEGGMADVLYVWCSMTYASREPFFSEDGPMNCTWMHPSDMRSKEKKHTKDDFKPVTRPKVVKKEKPEPEIIKFKYTNGVVAKGDGYTVEFPDDFVVNSDVEDRDFVAYIPNEEDPDDYNLSSFTVFAVRKEEADVYSTFRIPIEYGAVLKLISQKLGTFDSGMNQESWVQENFRADLPGGIQFTFERGDGALHAIAVYGVDKHLQIMRVLVTGVTRKTKDAYAKLVDKIFSRMTVKKPVKTLPRLDDPKFIEMGTDARSVNKWIKCVDEYCDHINSAEKMYISVLADGLKGKQNSANVVKNQVAEIKRHINTHAADYLIVAEALYTYKRAQNPDGTGIKKMKQAIEKMIRIFNKKIDVGGEPVTAKIRLTSTMEKRFTDDPIEVFEDIMDKSKPKLSSELISAYETVKDAYARFNHVQRIKDLVRLMAERRDYEIKKADYQRAKVTVEPQLEDLENRQSETEYALKEKEQTYNRDLKSLQDHLSSKETELGHAKASYDGYAGVAATAKRKAEKAFLFKGKRAAEYEEKQKAADYAKAVLDGVQAEVNGLNSHIANESKVFNSEMQYMNSQLSEIATEKKRLSDYLKSMKETALEAKETYESDKEELL